MNKFNVTKREVVTPEDRRVVFMKTRDRTMQEKLATPTEAFVRHLLKARMGWARNEPAPESIKAVARELATTFRPKIAVQL